MKTTLALFLITMLTFLSNGQEPAHGNISLTVSPAIDQTSQINQRIINNLKNFLANKNDSLTENSNWLPSDFKKYVYPYLDIYNIENSKYGENFYRPILMEIISTANPDQKIIKIAFIGHRKETEENQLKLIYNLVANSSEDQVLFSRYLDYVTSGWSKQKRGSLTYRISPKRKFSESEAVRQLKEIEKVCRFFRCNPIPATYYSCIDAKEVFEIKGFDYHPMMYTDKTGGFAEYGSIILSGNDSECYTHEIVHIYTAALYPRSGKFLDEGIATYFGGSGKFGYTWHRNKLSGFLSENPGYDLSDHLDPYERVFFENETSIPYLTAALILERTMRVYGKEKLLSLLNSESELWDRLKEVGLTKDNFNAELREQLKLPVTSVKI